MPIYGGAYGNTPTRTKKSGYLGEPASKGALYDGPGPTVPSVDPGYDPLRGPGAMNVAIADPGATAEDLAQQQIQMQEGLRAMLFGTSAPDAKGKHGGVLNIGDVPVLGDVLRGGADIAGGILGGVLSAGGQVADRAKLPMPGGDAIEQEALNTAWDAIPSDSAAKKEAIVAMEADHGILGTDIFTKWGHIKSAAIAAYAEEQSAKDPSLWTGLIRPSGSITDSVMNLFGGMSAAGRVVQRGFAGMDKSSGNNQLDNIMLVGSGAAAWDSGEKDMNPSEALVYAKRSSGEWTDEQALDFMASHEIGFSHDQLTQIASTILLDPLLWATLGAGALAKMGKVGYELSNIVKSAESAAAFAREQAVGKTGAELIAAQKKVAETQRAVDIFSTRAVKDGDLTRLFRGKLNPVAQAAHSQTVGNALRKYGSFYGDLAKGEELASLGRIAKVTRTVIDPLHMWGQGVRIDRAIAEGSEEVTHALVYAHGEGTHISNMHSLAAIDGMEGTVVNTMYEKGLAIAAANHLRRIAGVNYRVAQWGANKLEWLMTKENLRPSTHLEGILAGVKKRTLVQLEEDTIRNMKRDWTLAEDENLALRLSRLWGGLDEAGWLAELQKTKGGKAVWTVERKALLHQATWGSALSDLHKARAAVQAGGEAGVWADKLKDIILVNKTTLTDFGADGIVTDIGRLLTNDAKMAFIEKAMFKYPELRNFVKDRTNPGKTIDDFLDFIERKKDYLPHQITNAERPNLPASLREFDGKITWTNEVTGESEGIYTLALRPKDEFLWGLERNTEGVLDEVGNPWVDQVSDGLTGFSPVRELSYNVAGAPIPARVVAKGARVIDALESSGRTMMHGVTGTMVSEAARARFVNDVTSKYEAAGIDKTSVEGIWKGIQDYMRGKAGYSSARGLSADDLWEHVGRLTIKDSAWERAGLNRRALLQHVLDAYDGDVRTIGLTQKMTGRVKAMVYEMTGNNTLGEISEHAWPLLKFRLNPFFAAQELVEPWILNAQRGASIAGRATAESLTEADQMALAVFRNMTQKNLVHMADNDIAELAAAMGWGKELEARVASQGSAHNFMFGKLNEMLTDVTGASRQNLKGFTNVKGVKQLNMMRTWQKNLGKEMKAAMENVEPGRWDDIVTQNRLAAKEMLSEDEVAVRIMYEKMAANDVKVTKVYDASGKFLGWDTDFTNAITVGRWAQPQSLGALEKLDLEHMAARLGLRGRNSGNILGDAGALREALVTHDIEFDDIRRGLVEMNAHPDYIMRADSAFSFSYRRFWDQVTETYGLTSAERLGFENMYAAIADKRGMTSTEYLSQIYQPQVIRGTDHAVGSLGAAIDVMRGGKKVQVADLARLAGIEGTSTVDDLYRQMGAIMSAHLDPSAKLGFLREIMDRGTLPTEMSDVMDHWETLGATDLLVERIMHFVRGTPGTGARVAIADDAVGGIAPIRDAATDILSGAGHPRNLQRGIFDDSPELGREIADVFEGMTRTYQHVATSAGLATPVDMRLVNGTRANPGLAHDTSVGGMKAEAMTLDENTLAGYQAHMLESRKLYLRITQPTSAGGLGIRVKPVDELAPYADAAAMRADLANGVIKVPRTGYWHPLYFTDDLFLQRVVKDVFGHGQEDNILNSQDALISAAALYSNDGRAAMLSDEFARQAWETYSTKTIEQAVAVPRDVTQYEARFGAAADSNETMSTSSQIDPRTSIAIFQSRTLGSGLRAAPPDVQEEAISFLSGLRNEFPDVELHAFDIQPLPYAGATLQFNLEHPTIVMGLESGWQSDPAVRAASRARRVAAGDASVNATHFNWGSGNRPRRSPLGTRQFTSSTPTGDLAHEFGHAVDIHLYRAFQRAHGRVPKSFEYLSPALSDFMKGLWAGEMKTQLSEYAYKLYEPGALQKSDTFAELFDLAFNPEQAARVEQMRLDGVELWNGVQEFKRLLADEGIYVKGGRAVPINPHAGKTVAEANAAGAAVKAEHRVGLLPQPMLDKVNAHFLGSGRFAESNPDVARLAAYMQEHMQTFTAAALRDPLDPRWAKMFDEMSGMPVGAAVPYNLTEASLMNGVVQSMASKWEDAFRLQYFAQNRSMLQRSINHPMFGLYPASYMWGKVGPELVKFIATEPFGMNTGALAYALRDMQTSVAMQRQFDPAFDAKIEELGHSAALGFLGYMLPATPWDLPASYPAWLRDFATQGLDNEAAAKAGGVVSDANFISPLGKMVDPMNPFSKRVNWLGRALDEVGMVLPWNAPQAADATTVADAALDPMMQPPLSADNGAPSVGIDLSGTTTGLGTTDILSEQMVSLQALLAAP